MNASVDSATEGWSAMPSQRHETTSLYNVIATLQTCFPEDCDALLVALVCQWIRSGRIRFLGDTIA